MKYRGISTQAGGSAAHLPRLRLLAKGAFEQRFLANSPSWPGSARPRPRGAPSGCTSCAGRGGRGPFTPLRCHGSREGSQAVTNPSGGLVFPRPSAAARGFALGLVTARSSCALFLPIFAHFLGTLWCTFLRVLPLFFGAFLRAVTAQLGPPNSAALGLCLTSFCLGPERGPSGRPSHPLGRVAPDSFTSI